MPVKNSKAATLLTLAQAAACLLFRRDTVSRVGARDTLDEKKKKTTAGCGESQVACRGASALGWMLLIHRAKATQSPHKYVCKTIASVKAPLAVTLRAGAQAPFPHLLPRAMGRGRSHLHRLHSSLSNGPPGF